MSSSEYMDKENVVHLYLQWNIIQPYYYYYVNSVMSDSQRPHGLQPTRLFHPWDFPGKSTGVGCHCLLRVVSYDPLYFWVVCCDFSIFISNFVNLILPFFLNESG